MASQHQGFRLGMSRLSRGALLLASLTSFLLELGLTPVFSAKPEAIAAVITAKPAVTLQAGIGGVRLEDSETAVRRILGKPKQMTVSENPAIGVVRTLIYPGITLELAEGEKQRFFVFSIYTTATQYATLQGVRVGDPKTKVLSIYGQTREIQESGRTLLVYQIPDTYRSLTFEMFQGKVKAIRCFAYLN